MAVKTRFTDEMIAEALKASGGSVSKAAAALGCTEPTVYNYRNRARNVNGHAVEEASIAVSAALRHHEKRIAEIEKLITERAFHEEQAERLRVALGVLTPKAPEAPVSVAAA